MPWQRQVADTALEVDPETGRLAYRQVTLTVPRQSGKTTLILALAVHRALALAPSRIVYTAQTRLDARKKWEDDQLPILARSPFGEGGRFYKVRKSTGNEAVIFVNGSHYGIMSVTKKSGHGPTIDMALIDEAFAQEDSRLEQAFKPSMITRESPQTWIVSTAGDESSQFLRSKVDAGRAKVQAGVTGRNAYFEWSAPEKAGADDPAVWRGCMPALGFTVSEDAIRADYESMVSEGKLSEFRRAYLNQWLDEVPAEWLVIPRQAWEDLKVERLVMRGQVTLAADVSPRDRSGAIAAVWQRGDGNVDVEIVEHRPGTAWMPQRITELVRKHRPAAMVIDKGPGHSLVDALTALGVEVTCPDVGEVADGCARFLDAVLDSRSVRHDGDASLTTAVAGAVRRDLGDRWAWARKAPVVDISPLVAVTLAFWAHDKFADRKAPYDILRSVG